jgi:ArsR family transcriptional regulator
MVKSLRNIYRSSDQEVLMRLRKTTGLLDETEAVLIADVSDALAHPARVKIYQFILEKNKDMIPVCNQDLVAAFEYSQSTISQHVKKLIDANLIQMKKQDKKSMYFANIGRLSQYLAATRKFNTFGR